ncbi:MAG: nitroreductase family protein [Candidatus Aenigmatarchaeota archaeon]
MLEVIKKRRSIRKFQKKEVEKEKLEEILKAAMYAPSAMHRRPWEFIVVKDKETKEKLSKATPFCYFVKDAPVVLVIAAKSGILSKFWVEDCAIAAENIYLEATNQGLGTCFCQIMGGKTVFLRDSEEYVREVIKAPKSVRILGLMPIGYPAEKKPEHTEKEFEKKKVHYEKW